MLVPNAPNVTVGTFCVGCMLYLLSVCDVEGGGSHLDGPWCPVEGGGIVVSKGGCVVDGIFANLPAFAMLEATSYFFSFAVLFVPMAVCLSFESGSCCRAGGDADRCFLPAATGPASLS
jgi:hypothetical protein